MILDISGLNKADLLTGLFNAARVDSKHSVFFTAYVMTHSDAEQVLTKNTVFDSFQGREMMVNLSGNEFDSERYDFRNGQGKAESIVNAIRNKTVQAPPPRPSHI